MKKGFSLIELIVVVTIIAVITVAGVVGYGSVNKKSRDSRRVSDLEKIRMALEVARQTGVTYPATVPLLVGSSILQAVPKDPKTGVDYLYTIGGNNYTFTLSAQMEDLGSTNMPGGLSTWNYQVTNP